MTRARAEHGQSTVELALLLPMLVFGLLALVQTALVVRDAVGVVHASREAARVAAVEPDPRRAIDAAHRVLGDAIVTVSPRPAVGAPIAVEVEYRSSTRLPLVGPLFPDPVLRSRTEMRVER